MNITGKTMIFKSDKGYSTSISNKKEDGTYENMYLTINFKKGVELENQTKIDIKNGFFSFYTNKEGRKIPKIIVTEFETDSIENIPEVNVVDEDLGLPF